MDEETSVQDPFTYIGRVHRNVDTGYVETLEVFRDTDSIHVEEGDEFITFQTVITLEEKLY